MAIVIYVLQLCFCVRCRSFPLSIAYAIRLLVLDFMNGQIRAILSHVTLDFVLCFSAFIAAITAIISPRLFAEKVILVYRIYVNAKLILAASPFPPLLSIVRPILMTGLYKQLVIGIKRHD